MPVALLGACEAVPALQAVALSFLSPGRDPNLQCHQVPLRAVHRPAPALATSQPHFHPKGEGVKKLFWMVSSLRAGHPPLLLDTDRTRLGVPSATSSYLQADLYK